MNKIPRQFIAFSQSRRRMRHRPDSVINFGYGIDQAKAHPVNGFKALRILSASLL